MKKIWFLGLCAILICVCTACTKEQGTLSIETGEEESAEQELLSYTDEERGFSVSFPEEMADFCSISVVENGWVQVALEDGGDGVAWIGTTPTQEYEENLGMSVLAEKEGVTVFLQMPTCGTLNNEAVRGLWDEMREAAKEISVSFEEEI